MICSSDLPEEVRGKLQGFSEKRREKCDTYLRMLMTWWVLCDEGGGRDSSTVLVFEDGIKWCRAT